MSDYPPSRAQEPSGEPSSGSTTDTAKEAAASVTGDVKAQTQQVAAHAADETKQVVDQAKNELQDLFWRSRSELAQQASEQQHRLAGGLRSFGQELDEMASGSQRQGLAGQTASQLSGRIQDAASFLEERDFSGVVDELSSFARRRPGAFLLGAAVIGLVAGRVTRGLSSGPNETTSPSSRSGMSGALTSDESVQVPAAERVVGARPAEPVIGAAGVAAQPAYSGIDTPLDVAGQTSAAVSEPVDPLAPTAHPGLNEPYATDEEVTEPPPTDPGYLPQSPGERPL